MTWQKERDADGRDAFNYRIHLDDDGNPLTGLVTELGAGQWGWIILYADGQVAAINDAKLGTPEEAMQLFQEKWDGAANG